MQVRKRHVYIRDDVRDVYNIIEVTELPEQALTEYRADKIAECLDEENATNICRGLDMQENSDKF